MMFWGIIIIDKIIDRKYHDESKMHRAHTDPLYEDEVIQNVFLNLWPTNMYMMNCWDKIYEE